MKMKLMINKKRFLKKTYRHRTPHKGILQILAVLFIAALFPGTSFSQMTPITETATEVPLQLSTGQHVLRFKQEAYTISGIGHTLKVSFVNAKPVKPRPGNAPDEMQRAPVKTRTMDSVCYPDLWHGVSLVMKRRRGLVESFYHVAPENSPLAHPRKRPVDSIRLRYNRPVMLDPAGNLVIGFNTGRLRESAPVAWQQIEGRRIPVPVAFKILGRYEVGFKVAAYNPAYPLVIDPEITWNTFLGAETSEEYARDMVLDKAGNIYVVGSSRGTWGSPVTPGDETNKRNAYVAKFDNSGNLIWNTFFGSDLSWDAGYSVALDSVGRLFIAGIHGKTWNGPVEDAIGGYDAFVARLDSQTGKVIWRTFVGSEGNDMGMAILADETGSVYLKGSSESTWGAPINQHASVSDGDKDEWDIFIAKFYAQNGGLQWHTFMGSKGKDDADFDGIDVADGHGLAMDGDGYLYVSGTSDRGWGEPLNQHTPGENQDAFVAKLTGDGRRIWHTFIGSGGADFAGPVTVDDSGNLYMVGKSNTSWGAPINDHNQAHEQTDNTPDEMKRFDVFVTRLDAATGLLAWNTFFGSYRHDTGADIVLDTNGNIYVAGEESEGNYPDSDHSGGYVAKLNSTGHHEWRTHIGSRGNDISMAIATDAHDRLYILGDSQTAEEWGNTTVNPHSGKKDSFIAHLVPDPKLTVQHTGIGNGKVTSDPAGINCGQDCSAKFKPGDVITLTATPGEGMTFGGWSGFGCHGVNTCVVTMTDDLILTDRFLTAHFGNPALDADDDGVSNTDEQGPLSNNPEYDGNGDGIADWLQADVVSLPTADGQNYVTLSSSEQLPFDRFSTSEIEPATNPPDDIDFELGVFNFSVNTSAPGGTVALTLQLDEGMKPDTYYKFGPTPDNPQDHWYEFLYDGTTGAEIKDNVIILHFKDGDRGDSDLDATNSTITDPGGPGFSSPTLGPNESGIGGIGGGSGGTCFIHSMYP